MKGTGPLDVEPKPVPWRNEQVQGLGYFFRDEDAAGESLLVLRCGNSWGHHHNDEGSLHYFYAGRAWIVDSAFSYPQETGVRKFRADGHSRWAPRDVSPLNHFWQFNRGWIVRQDGNGPFPYAIAFTPVYMADTPVQHYVPLRVPILHWRGVVQLAPFAFLVVDCSSPPGPEVVRFHVPADAPVALGEDPPPEGNDFYLRLRPLLGLGPAQVVTTDHPTQAGGRYATREVRCDGDGKSPAVYLVVVEKAGTPSAWEVEAGTGGVQLRHPSVTAELKLDGPDQFTLVNGRTGRQVTLALNETAGSA